jgi:hypothetical protein
MRYVILATMLAAAACGGNVVVDETAPCEHPDATPASDAMIDREVDAAPDNAWTVDARNADAPEAGPPALCCEIGSDLPAACTGGYVDSGPPSWTCGSPDGSIFAPCSQTGAVVCALGSPCQGPNGAGTIVVCGACRTTCWLYANQADPDAGFGVAVKDSCCTPKQPCTACHGDAGCDLRGICEAP